MPAGPVDSNKTVILDKTAVLVVTKGVYSAIKIIPKDAFSNKAIIEEAAVHLEIRKVSTVSGATLSVADVGRIRLRCIRVATNFQGLDLSAILRTLFLKAGLIRLKLFESAISPEHCGIEGQNFIPMLFSSSLKFGGHVTQNGRYKWYTKCGWPTLFPYPCGGVVLIVESNYDIMSFHRGDF